MNKSNRTGSHLFFIEFIIVLFFFLIASTVCLRLFARAHGITQRADALSHAQAAAASVAAVAEDILADKTGSASATAGSVKNSADSENLLQTIAKYLPGASLSVLPEDPPDREGLVIFYTDDFQTCTADEARYLLTAALDPADSQSGQDSQGESAGQTGPEATLQISVTDYEHAPVYELSVTLHRPATRKEALQ